MQNPCRALYSLVKKYCRVVGEFETFLRGCGFNFDGYLEVAQEPIVEKYSKDSDDLDMYTESIFNKK